VKKPPKPAGEKPPKPAGEKPPKPAGEKKPKGKAAASKKRKVATSTKKEKPPVPETLKKRKASRKEIVEKWNAIYKKQGQDRKKMRALAYKRAKRYEREYQKSERDLITKRRQARATGSFYVDPEPKIAIVVRIRGIMGVSPKVKKILRLLRLRRLHSATFVKLSHPMSKMLKLVEPYITYGYPNLKTVQTLVYKRGFASIRGQRLRISDNQIIHNNLKNYNVSCIEDVIHEIYTCGKNFKWVNKFMWPFKLNSPRGGYIKKRVHFTEGGDAGNREHYINKLIRKMI